MAVQVDLLVDEMKNLEGVEEPEPGTWDWGRDKLRSMVLENDGFENFLRWPVVEGAMVVNSVPTVEHDWPIVRDWWDEYHSGLLPVDPLIGGPTEIVTRGGYTTTINAIRQLRHIAIMESVFGVEFDSDLSILEFGGGYGLMAYLFREMGFEGKYTIYDFPEFSLLQRYYLGEIGCSVKLVSDLGSVPECDLLIAMDSLTEVNDISERHRFLSRALPESMVIRFANDWGGVDNVEWLKSTGFFFFRTEAVEDGFESHRSYWFTTNKIL